MTGTEERGGYVKKKKQLRKRKSHKERIEQNNNKGNRKLKCQKTLWR